MALQKYLALFIRLSQSIMQLSAGVKALWACLADFHKRERSTRDKHESMETLHQRTLVSDLPAEHWQNALKSKRRQNKHVQDLIKIENDGSFTLPLLNSNDPLDSPTRNFLIDLYLSPATHSDILVLCHISRSFHTEAELPLSTSQSLPDALLTHGTPFSPAARIQTLSLTMPS
ncbi:uncharacterized protein LACBIDRAFT_308687 [Laccaria bicolor S238N-H82]|uniref:Predicted protein n=1 Tax=Laccaria bicolor (strain S238N-H82 / ATCC MYA-4686) TaxID=486041 RepID=B0CWY3_LACBS|nr:uncharacterized protein LACBIDRAFT_308687 [Laccaria bicolor S238N-H82]EDR13149.1 predicted protein [Laccaria bicolor S238N-H82]|eukprot:XP_001875647.1 predicted protein [Laccaria bicolor S238N-H82]